GGARVLGDSLGALGHGVLGQLTGQRQADSRLDLAGGEGGLLGVTSQLASLRGEAVENVTDEGVQDGNTTLGDTSVGMHLLEHLVDVGAIALHAGLLLGALACLLRGLGGLLRGGLGHCVRMVRFEKVW
ncbi:histone H2B, partial [Nannochloropsis gaditana CCMP526]|uniref:histone H2B n=1 Tax=Nannochloropsis gaditana (strain CCMP526) TaxID=1093141 RepID=UPI00029F7F26